VPGLAISFIMESNKLIKIKGDYFLGRVGVIVLCLVCSLLLGGCNGWTSNRGSLNAGQKDFAALGAKLSSQELLFIFNQDISSKGVIRRLGEPAEKSAAAVWGADGLEHQSWFYYTKGIELDMVRENGMRTIVRHEGVGLVNSP